MDNFIIDPEFRDKIPPLSAEEFAKLEENILADGEVLEPLVLWGDTIIDGHHRWKIIQAHPEIPYNVKRMEFVNKWAAVVWMCRNQLGRRNVTPAQREYLIKEEHDALVKTHGAADGFRGNQYTKVVIGQNDQLPKQDGEMFQARKVVAKEHGIKESEVRRAVEFGRGLDAAEEASPGIRESVLSGQVKAPKNLISEMRNIPEEHRADAVEALKHGDTDTAKAIIRVNTPMAK